MFAEVHLNTLVERERILTSELFGKNTEVQKKGPFSQNIN